MKKQIAHATFLAIAFLFTAYMSLGQTQAARLELVHADSMEVIQSSGADPAGMKIFYGRVVFRQSEVLFKSDTATLYVDKNILIGRGNIQVQKDSVFYNGMKYTIYSNSNSVIIDDRIIELK